MSEYQPPRVYVPIYNAGDYTYVLEGAAGLTPAQADLLYVRLTKSFQTITGFLTISNGLQVGNGITSSGGITSTQYSATTIPIASFNTTDIQFNFKDNISGTSDGTGLASIKTASGGTGGGEDTRLKGYVKGTEVVRLQNNSVVSTGGTKSLSNQPVVWAMDRMTVPMTTTRNGSDVKIGFRKPASSDVEEPELYTGIACQYVIDASQRMGFFVAGNEGMYFDASNMIVSSTFRSNNNRAVTGDIGFRFLSAVSTGWGDRFQFYDNSIGAGGFQQTGHWNYQGFGFYRPVYIGANELGREADATNYATGITIHRRLAPIPITVNGNNDGSVPVSIGKTLPNTQYNILTEVEFTSGVGLVSTGVSNKTTSQFTLNYHYNTSGSVTFNITPILIGYV